jgi:hypothetical protein
LFRKRRIDLCQATANTSTLSEGCLLVSVPILETGVRDPNLRREKKQPEITIQNNMNLR